MGVNKFFRENLSYIPKLDPTRLSNESSSSHTRTSNMLTLGVIRDVQMLSESQKEATRTLELPDRSVINRTVRYSVSGLN